MLGIGLISALRSTRYESRAMGELARMGLITLAPEEDSPARQEKEVAIQQADRAFRRSLVCTALGVLFQTLGSLL